MDVVDTSHFRDHLELRLYPMYRYSSLASARVPPPSPPAPRLSAFFAPFPPLTASRTRPDLAACPSRCTVISALYSYAYYPSTLLTLRLLPPRPRLGARTWLHTLWYNMGARSLYSTLLTAP